ncbi:hypothetical protein LJK88_16665 [Paenibacillus sp. P26]|nr:hypothetical protein LJK88_16665 [Paenibacillus sp. P26]
MASRAGQFVSPTWRCAVIPCLGPADPRFGTGRLLLSGLMMMLLSYLLLGRMQTNWSPWTVAWLLLIYGTGGALLLPSSMSAIMGAVGAEKQGTIGAVQRMIQNLGIAIYTSVAAAIVPAHSVAGTDGLMAGIRQMWNLTAGSILLCIVVFLCFRPRRK